MTYDLPNNSFVKVHDIFDELPSFMKYADCLFVDIPYNQALLTNFAFREEVTISEKNTNVFSEFIKRLWECITEIAPETLFIETGKEALAELIIEAKQRYKYVTFYNSTYYRKKENKCYVIHCTNYHKERRYKQFEDMDEEDIIKAICSGAHRFKCIGDLCMGMGLVGKHAYLNGKQFVGTELNPKRLAVLVDFIKNN